MRRQIGGAYRREMTSARHRLRRLVRYHPLTELATLAVRKDATLSMPEVALELRIEPGDILIDCGANVGDITSRFARTGAVVHAFEPGPRAFRILRRRFANVPSVICHNEGVLDRECELSFHVPRAHGAWDDVDTTVSGSLMGEALSSSVPTDDVVVRCISLAEFIFGLASKVRLLKLDVEGAEIAVLNDLIDKGAIHRIEHVIAETHEAQMPELGAVTQELRKRVEREGLASKIQLDWI